MMTSGQGAGWGCDTEMMTSGQGAGWGCDIEMTGPTGVATLVILKACNLLWASTGPCGS